MKVFFIKIFNLLILLLIICSCNKKDSQKGNIEGEDLDQYGLSYKQASESPIIETKLFDGFKIGMSPQQVDSVFNIWVKDTKVIKTLEAGQTYGTIDPFYSEAKIDSYSYKYDVGLPYTLDIQFYPQYIDNELIELYCSIQTPKENMDPEKVYKFLADEFEKSERGKEFQKFNLKINDQEIISFIKDNLEIQFFPQPGTGTSSISYRNVPSMKKLIEQEKAKRRSH